MITNVTIISTNLNRNIINNYQEYFVIEDNFKLEDLKKYKKVLFYNVLSNLQDLELQSIYSFLKNNNIDFINVTNNIEEALYTENLIIYDKDKILASGKTIKLFENEKLFKKLGLKLPFIVELSILLKDYNLVNKIYLDKKSLVGDLWK